MPTSRSTYGDVKVAVGSENPVKISAVEQGFAKVWPNIAWQVSGVKVGSKISDQPMSDQESITGATNRAQAALAALHADYGVGLEGGLQQIGQDWFDCGWVVILNRKGQRGLSSSGRMWTPSRMIAKVKEGMELGNVDDLFFGTENSKQDIGHFGLMTNGSVTRADAYCEATIMAAAAFLHPQFFVSDS